MPFSGRSWREAARCSATRRRNSLPRHQRPLVLVSRLRRDAERRRGPARGQQPQGQQPERDRAGVAERPAGFVGRVAAFGAWDVLPFILSVERSKLPVGDGFPPVPNPATDRDAPSTTWPPTCADLGRRAARRAHHARRDRMPAHAPARVLYVLLGETDEWAHEPRYDLYLDAAYRPTGSSAGCGRWPSRCRTTRAGRRWSSRSITVAGPPPATGPITGGRSLRPSARGLR